MENLKITYHNISELIPDPDNIRRHDKRNIDAIKESIIKFGVRKPIVVHEKSKIIYAGNGVYEAAKELGITEIPCAWIPADTPSEVAKAFAIYDNRTSDLSSFDPVKLDKLLSELPDINLDELLWTPVEYDELLASLETENAKKEETFDAVAAMEAEGEPVSKIGDVWLCGKHRVMAGDSTKAEDMVKLMKGEKADLVFTDPPFDLVNYAYIILIEQYLQNGYCFIMCDDQQVQEILRITKMKLQRFFVLDHTFSSPRGNDVYVRHILVMRLLNGRTNFAFKNLHDGFQSIIKFDYRGNLARKETLLSKHQKPVSIIVLFLNHYSNQNDLIFDPFLGSGTTLIACQKTGHGRRCFGMELSPHYCDIICQRFYDFTGIIPILEATGEPFPIDKK